MILYIEKGIGMHDAIREAGFSLYEKDGVWVSSDDVAVQAIIDAYVAPVVTPLEASRSNLLTSLESSGLSEEQVTLLMRAWEAMQ